MDQRNLILQWRIGEMLNIREAAETIGISHDIIKQAEDGKIDPGLVLSAIDKAGYKLDKINYREREDW